MTVSGPRARRRACAGLAAAGAGLTGLALVLSASPAGAAPPPTVLVGPVAVGQPPLTARRVARNPFLPLIGRGAGAPAGDRVEPVLRRGDTGDAVRRLQQGLAPLTAGAGDLVVDGVFGRRTAAAVTAFQATHGLVADGRVGPRTWDALASRSGR